VRAEGCGVVVLKRLDEAVRDGDRIIALIRGSAVNQDGRSNGLTAPSGPSQCAVVRAALADAGVAPSQIGYVEAHGTGTPLGDPIELNALAEVLGEGRSPQAQCWVGSVKSNIGHLEGAAGIAGLIKAALCVERAAIPRNLHFRGLNPHIRIAGTGLAVPTRTESWPEGAAQRVAGVSSFGFGGTNAHVIVAAPPLPAPRQQGGERPRHLLCASARSAQALNTLLGAYARRLRELPDEALADFCFSANSGRSSFAYRAAAVGSSCDELAESLERMSGGEDALPGAIAVRGKALSKAPPIVFLFGQADPEAGPIADQLFRGSPAYADAVMRCLRLLDAGMSERLMREPRDSVGSTPTEHTVHGFVAQYAAWQLWQAMGVRPAEVCAVRGGLLAAACAAGSLSLEDGLRLCAAADAARAESMLSLVSVKAPELGLIIPYQHGASEPAAALATRLLDLGGRAESVSSDALWIAMDPRLAASADAARLSHARLAGCDAGPDGWSALLGTLGRLFVAGIAPDWKALDAPHSRRRIDVPTYPFERQRYWFPSGEVKTAEPVVVENIRVAAGAPQPMELESSAAFETTAHLDWLALELTRMDPSTRRKLLEPFLDEARQSRVPGGRIAEAPLTSADIQRLSEEEAEAVLRRRLESMNY
jgi:acyl transferase domain-containing protein